MLWVGWGRRREVLFLGNVLTVGPWAWSRLGEVRDVAFSLEFLSPQRRPLPLPRLLRKEMMPFTVPFTFVSLAFVPWEAQCLTRPSTS